MERAVLNETASFYALLNGNCGYVLHSLHMTHSSPALPLIFCGSSGTHLHDHLAAKVAGLAGGQLTVAATPTG